MRLQQRRVLRRRPRASPGRVPSRWPAAPRAAAPPGSPWRRPAWRRRRGLLARSLLLAHLPGRRAQPAAQQQKRNGRQAREQRPAPSARRWPAAAAAGCRTPACEIRAQPVVGAGAGHDQAARNRDHQRRDHRHQAVADGQHGVGFERVAQIHAVLQDADQEAGDDVDAGDQDAGHGIALREARGAVHGAVEFGFAWPVAFAALARFGFVDQAGVQVGIDGHLLAGQGVQGEARGDFGDAHRAMVDDHVLNGDQDQEDHRADDVVAAHHEVAEGLDHVAGGAGAGVAVQQDQARGGDVQRQPEQRQQQQGGGKDAELDRLADVHRRPSSRSPTS